ncbi:MAG: HEAT repeat domain-containing protein [Planctomycetota bacterium]|nr:MAG: HEAT repeat domain-containing protein [Planctomycetota bacterium]
MYALLLLPVPQAVSVQDDLDARIEAYEEVVKDKGRVPEAISHLDGLLQHYQKLADRRREIAEALEFDEGDPKALKKEDKELARQQERIVDAVWLAFDARSRKRARPPENVDLWRTAAVVLGRMGEEGAKYLWEAFEDKRFTKDVEFRAHIVRQIGSTRDWDQWKELVDLLDYKDELVIAAAAESLARFGEAPAKIRQESTKYLVKRLESYQNAALDGEDTTARRVYRTVREPMTRALSALTGQSFRDPLDWTKWWNNVGQKKDYWKED